MKKILVSSNLCFDKYKNVNIDVKKDLNNYLITIGYCPIYYYSDKINYKFLSKCDGLVLSGSGNINLIKKNKLNFLRDKFELKLFKYFKKEKKPILAICRGLQLISSYQKAKIIKVKNHVRTNHYIYFDRNKEHFKKKLKVNSYHDYGIKNNNIKNFNLIARCQNNFLELAYNKKYKFLGLMFHPERYNISQIEINKFVKKFFK